MFASKVDGPSRVVFLLSTPRSRSRNKDKCEINAFKTRRRLINATG